MNLCWQQDLDTCLPRFLCLKEMPRPLSDNPSVDPQHVAQEDDGEARVQETGSQATHGAASKAFDMGFPGRLPVAHVLAGSYESFETQREFLLAAPPNGHYQFRVGDSVFS